MDFKEQREQGTSPKGRTERERRNEQVRGEIQEAYRRKDIFAILAAGFENFMAMLFDSPIDFERFLEETGRFFDAFILEEEKAENLTYVGGTFRMELKNSKTIPLSAKLYFQNEKKEWILEEKKGSVRPDQFEDWETNQELNILRKKGKLDFPIEPPKGDDK